MLRGACGLLTVSMIALQGCAHSPAPEAATPVKALVLVTTRGVAPGALTTTASALQKRMALDGSPVILYPQAGPEAGVSLPSLDPKQAPRALSAAWEAYYQLDLERAKQRVWAVTAKVSPQDGLWAQAMVLGALIHFAAGEQQVAAARLREVRGHWPALALPAPDYPPRFVSLYERTKAPTKKAAAESGLALDAGDSLRDLQGEVRRLARRQQWTEIWLIRVVPIGWTSRVDLQGFSRGGRRTEARRSFEIKPGTTPDKVAALLWPK